MLSMGPKSVTNSSAAPRAMSRSRIVSNDSIDSAWRARWSMRPRPNIGVWRSASELPSISKTLSSDHGPTWMIDIRSPGSTSAPTAWIVASKTSS